jgi:opacity protein-like surface antigen
LIVAPAAGVSAANGWWSLIVKGNYTSGSRIQPNPYAPDPIQRGQQYDFDDTFGASLELRFRIPESSIALGLSADYITGGSERSLPTSGRRAIPVTDGYTLVPVEATAYFLIPVTTGALGVFMGGGAGVYFGERSYTIAGVEAPLLESTPGFGIHVLGGVSYQVTDVLGLVLEMKFRDAHFEAVNQFAVSRITFAGTVVNVSPNPFESRVRSDGMTIQLGASLSF